MIIQSSENDLDAEDSQSDILPEYGADVYSVAFQVESKAYQVAGINGTTTKSIGATVIAGSKLTVSGNSITCETNSYPRNQTFKAEVQSNCKYQFDHWEISPSTTVNSATTCTAIFSVKQVTITFKTNNTSMGTVDRSSLTLNYGSSCSQDAWSGKLTITDGETGATTYVTPSAKSGYEFSKWSGDTTSITSSKTFTAYFKAPTVYYTVYFASNNGDYGSVSRSSLTVEEGTYFSTNGSKLSIDGYTISATEKTDTAQYDYSFGSWSSSSGYINGSRTIYANFNRTLQQYTVSFGTNDSSWGEVSPSSVTVSYGSAVSQTGNTLTIGTATVTANPSPDDSSYTYAFSSWQNVPTTITGATTITAIFTATQAGHTVQYYYDGAKISGYDELVPHGGTITHTTYSSGDLIFCGWYTDSSLASQYLFNNSTQVTQNYTLYALMAEPITFTSSPVADATITYLSWAGMVLFDSVGANSPYRVVWDFGDGTSSTDRTAYHLYSEPGTYTVKLSAYNYAGDVDTEEYHITISNEHQQQSDRTAIYAGALIAAIVSLFLITRIF